MKGVGSERSYEQLAQSLQTFGGSGFLGLPDRAVHPRLKIDTLYEGTTAIQGLDLFFHQDGARPVPELTRLGGGSGLRQGDAGNGTLVAARDARLRARGRAGASSVRWAASR